MDAGFFRLAAGGCLKVIERFCGADLLEACGAVIKPQVGRIGAEVENPLVHGYSEVQLSHFLEEQPILLQRFSLGQVLS